MSQREPSDKSGQHDALIEALLNGNGGIGKCTCETCMARRKAAETIQRLERELAEAEEQIAIQGFRKTIRTESSTAATRAAAIEECIKAVYAESARLSSYSEKPGDTSDKEARGAMGCSHALRALLEPGASLPPSATASASPLEMLMFCPRCQEQHIDAPDLANGWTNPPHATHTCQSCGLLWRPSNENTTGVPHIEVKEEKHLERIAASWPRAWEKVQDYGHAWVKYGKKEGIRADKHSNGFVYQVDEEGQWWAIPLPPLSPNDIQGQ